MGTKLKVYAVLVLIVMGAMLFSSAAAAEEKYSNDAALKGVAAVKGIFDVDTGDAEKIEVLLKVIGETFDTLKKDGKEPNFVVAFRGPSLRALVAEKEAANKSAGSKGAPLTAQINRLHAQGVHFEACAVASRLSNIDVKELPAVVNMVGNTFISLIGYQIQGYGLVALK